jgi:IMP dehydrogenase/GMP reductase
MNPSLFTEGLTFDDVLLVPRHSDVMPRDVQTATRFSRNTPIQIPLASAAMDTVTEEKLAVALAREGGIGVIHRNLSIELQAAEVDKVKRSANGVILDPVTLPPDTTMRAARDIMARHNISGLPIVDERKRVVGILTRRDCRFQTSDDTPVSKVMTRENLVTAPPGTKLDDARDLLFRHKVEKLLIVGPDMVLHGLITMKDLNNLSQYPASAVDARGRLRVAAAIGVHDYDRAAELVKKGVDVLVVDTAHGHSTNVVKALAAGASCVMLGSLFAGLEESPGEVILYKGRSFKSVRGMGSIGAMQQGGKERYRQGHVTEADKLVPEGIEGMVPYKGKLSTFAYQMVGGVRAGMGYCGAATIPTLWERARFVRITAAGVKESHPHDVTITKESPNYFHGD